MEVKPGYKQTEVGVIPEEWSLRGLGNVSDLDIGLSKPKIVFGSGCPVVTVQDLYAGSIINCSALKRVVVTEDEIQKHRLEKDDILIGNASVKRDGIGYSNRFDGSNEHVIFAKYAYRVRNLRSISPLFLHHVLRSTFCRQWIISSSQTGTLTNLNKSAAKAIPIPVPPLPEQRAIATALSDVDGLLGGLDRLIAKKRDLKQAAMQQLLTGQTRLPGWDGGWEVKRLGDFGKCLRGVSYKGDSDLSTHDTPHTKRLLRSNNVQNAVVVTDEVQFVNAARVSSHQILQQDDILICMANGSKALVGKAGIFMVSDGHEYTFGAFMGCFRTNSAEANPAFVFYLFLTARYRDYINNLLAGSSINNLRPSSIESLEFSTPPLPEQTAIASVLTEMDGELAVLEQRREKTRALKQAMMHSLLTGRIRLV
jgi:type I restriction enzyme S subunit